MSAYMFFATEERVRVKQIQPTWSILEVAKELGQRWNVLQPPQKAKYEALARKDKERYEREGGGRKERKGPKRPQSAYMFFVQEERIKLVKQHPKWTVPQVGSELGKRWRALTPAQKKKFEGQAQGDKGRYEREVGKQPSGAGTTTTTASGSSSPTAKASTPKKEKQSNSSSDKSSKAAASPKKSSPAKSRKSSQGASKAPRKSVKEVKPKKTQAKQK